jgi:hypothetical protein
LRDLGVLAAVRGDFSRAVDCLQGALRLTEAGGDDPYTVIAITAQIGWVALAMGDLALAQSSLQRALHAAHEKHEAWIEWFALLQLACLADRRGDWARHARWLGASSPTGPTGYIGRARRPLQAIDEAMAVLAEGKTRCERDPAFAAEWAVGASQRREVVIAEALSAWPEAADQP